MDWLQWFTALENSKVLALLVFFITFCLILIYVYASRSRSKRLESYKYIPFQDDDKADEMGDRVNKHERNKDS